MRTLWLCAVLALALARCLAEDITTLDGQTYKNVSDVRTTPEGLAFSYDVGTSRTVVPYGELPEALRKKYPYDVYAEGLRQARLNQWMDLKKSLAFPLSNLEAAKQKARAEGKLIGFIVVWDSFFTNNPARPMGKGSDDALAQFYVTFHNALVLVFVSHERELGNTPEVVRNALFSPEAGHYSPKMAVSSADCSNLVCFIPYGEEQTTGYEREAVIRKNIAIMKAFAAGSGK